MIRQKRQRQKWREVGSVCPETTVEAARAARAAGSDRKPTTQWEGRTPVSFSQLCHELSKPRPSPVWWLRSHAGAAGGQPGPCWRLAGQLDIAVWQVASANPREGLGGSGKDTPARLAHLSGDMCPTAPSSHLQPHPTRGMTADGEGSLGLSTG